MRKEKEKKKLYPILFIDLLQSWKHQGIDSYNVAIIEDSQKQHWNMRAHSSGRFSFPMIF